MSNLKQRFYWNESKSPIFPSEAILENKHRLFELFSAIDPHLKFIYYMQLAYKLCLQF